jgi:hypothetical protein
MFALEENVMKNWNSDIDFLKDVIDDRYVAIEQEDDYLFYLYSKCIWRLNRAEKALREADIFINFFGDDPSPDVKFFTIE